jgi:hypothetical protein
VTKKRAEVLTGCEIRRISDGSSAFCYGAYSGEELMAQAQHGKERTALTLLVRRVYQIHSRWVLEQCGWRCARCGRTYLLQIHHRQFRSHGGTQWGYTSDRKSRAGLRTLSPADPRQGTIEVTSFALGVGLANEVGLATMRSTKKVIESRPLP